MSSRSEVSTEALEWENISSSILDLTKFPAGATATYSKTFHSDWSPCKSSTKKGVGHAAAPVMPTSVQSLKHCPWCQLFQVDLPANRKSLLRPLQKGALVALAHALAKCGDECLPESQTLDCSQACQPIWEWARKFLQSEIRCLPESRSQNVYGPRAHSSQDMAASHVSTARFGLDHTLTKVQRVYLSVLSVTWCTPPVMSNPCDWVALSCWHPIMRPLDWAARELCLALAAQSRLELKRIPWQANARQLQLWRCILYSMNRDLVSLPVQSFGTDRYFHVAVYATMLV